MIRYALIYGGLAGAITISVAAVTVSLSDPSDMRTAEALGYLTMFAAMSLVFIGIKRWRDIEKGGVATFAGAFGVGAAMSLAAALIYAVGWEAFMFANDYAFTAEYAQAMREEIAAKGLAAAEEAEALAEIDAAIEMMANPALRLAVSMIEILPVALVVALISAAILRNPKVLPARAGRGE